MTESNQPNSMPESDKLEQSNLEKNIIQFLFALAFLLFIFSTLPDQALEGVGVGVKDFRNKYIFVTAPSSFFLIAFVALGFERGQRKLARKKLTMLTSAEKKVLAKYMAENTLSLELKETDKGVAGLMQGHVIKRQFITHRKIEFYKNYKIKPWILEHLKKHPEIIEIEKQKKIKV